MVRRELSRQSRERAGGRAAAVVKLDIIAEQLAAVIYNAIAVVVERQQAVISVQPVKLRLRQKYRRYLAGFEDISSSGFGAELRVIKRTILKFCAIKNDLGGCRNGAVIAK